MLCVFGYCCSFYTRFFLLLFLWKLCQILSLFLFFKKKINYFLLLELLEFQVPHPRFHPILLLYRHHHLLLSIRILSGSRVLLIVPSPCRVLLSVSIHTVIVLLYFFLACLGVYICYSNYTPFDALLDNF